MLPTTQTRFPRRHFAITASDSVKFHRPTTVYVGTGGDVAVKDWDTATTIVYKNVPDGSVLPIQVEQVLATGTVTATDFIGII